MTMFTKEMMELAEQDTELMAHMEALAAAAAVAALRAGVKTNSKAKAEAEAKAEAAKAAKAKAEAEAEAQANFLNAYPDGYVYVETAAEASHLKAEAKKVNLYTRTFIEKVVENSFIKVAFMRPKKEKEDKKA